MEKRVATLLRKLCANYDGGNCLLLDDGESCVCVQSISKYGIYCNYFKNAVLPADERLHADIMKPTGGKRCVLCHQAFALRAKNQRYCPACAAIALVDSNLHWEHILPSEKAYAYKLKMEALSHQGIACGQVGHKSRDDISDTDSGRQVQRYIRLTHLIPELLEKMDKEEIAFSVGVELSYLDEYSQRDVLEQCEINDCTPSYSQAWRMHKADREGLLTKDVIQFLMSEEKANQRETVKVPASRLREVLPKGLDAGKTEDFIIKACEYYRKYLIR